MHLVNIVKSRSLFKFSALSILSISLLLIFMIYKRIPLFPGVSFYRFGSRADREAISSAGHVSLGQFSFPR